MSLPCKSCANTLDYCLFSRKIPLGKWPVFYLLLLCHGLLRHLPHLWLHDSDCLFSFLFFSPSTSPGPRWDQPVLLVPVWWTCWLRSSSGRFQTAAAPYPGTAAGDRGYPEEHGCPPTHLPGRGAWQPGHQQQDTDTGSLPAWRRGGPGLTQHTSNTLLHREEDPTWVPGYWGYRKCIQGNGTCVFGFCPHGLDKMNFKGFFFQFLFPT